MEFPAVPDLSFLRILHNFPPALSTEDLPPVFDTITVTGVVPMEDRPEEKYNNELLLPLQVLDSIREHFFTFTPDSIIKAMRNLGLKDAVTLNYGYRHHDWEFGRREPIKAKARPTFSKLPPEQKVLIYRLARFLMLDDLLWVNGYISTFSYAKEMEGSPHYTSWKALSARRTSLLEILYSDLENCFVEGDRDLNFSIIEEAARSTSYSICSNPYR